MALRRPAGRATSIWVRCSSQRRWCAPSPGGPTSGLVRSDLVYRTRYGCGLLRVLDSLRISSPAAGAGHTGGRLGWLRVQAGVQRRRVCGQAGPARGRLPRPTDPHANCLMQPDRIDSSAQSKRRWGVSAARCTHSGMHRGAVSRFSPQFAGRCGRVCLLDGKVRSFCHSPVLSSWFAIAAQWMLWPMPVAQSISGRRAAVLLSSRGQRGRSRCKTIYTRYCSCFRATNCILWLF